MEYTFCIVKVYFKLHEFGQNKQENMYTKSIQHKVYKKYTIYESIRSNWKYTFCIQKWKYTFCRHSVYILYIFHSIISIEALKFWFYFSSQQAAWVLTFRQQQPGKLSFGHWLARHKWYTVKSFSVYFKKHIILLMNLPSVMYSGKIIKCRMLGKSIHRWFQ